MSRHETALDELHRLHHCYSAVGELLIPGNDLNAIDRDALAALMSYLDERYQEALIALESDLQQAG